MATFSLFLLWGLPSVHVYALISCSCKDSNQIGLVPSLTIGAMSWSFFWVQPLFSSRGQHILCQVVLWLTLFILQQTWREVGQILREHTLSPNIWGVKLKILVGGGGDILQAQKVEGDLEVQVLGDVPSISPDVCIPCLQISFLPIRGPDFALEHCHSPYTNSIQSFTTLIIMS